MLHPNADIVPILGAQRYPWTPAVVSRSLYRLESPCPVVFFETYLGVVGSGVCRGIIKVYDPRDVGVSLEEKVHTKSDFDIRFDS